MDGIIRGVMRIVSQCCLAESTPTFPYQSHWMSSLEKSIPDYFTCKKCGKVCKNKLIIIDESTTVKDLMKKK